MVIQHRVGKGTIGIQFCFVFVIISILHFGFHVKMNLSDFHSKEGIQRERSQVLHFCSFLC